MKSSDPSWEVVCRRFVSQHWGGGQNLQDLTRSQGNLVLKMVFLAALICLSHDNSTRGRRLKWLTVRRRISENQLFGSRGPPRGWYAFAVPYCAGDRAGYADHVLGFNSQCSLRS